MGVTSVPANTTVQMACQIMAERNIAILFVTEHNTICGSFSERDLLMKVAAGKLDPTLTPLKSVMSPLTTTISPFDTTEKALGLMREHGIRHLPVEVNGDIIAVVSMQELYESVRVELEDGIRHISSYVNGDIYSAATLMG
jgi:CBS domain-containing protein